MVSMSEPLEEAAHGFFYGGSHTETVLWARSSVHAVHELPVHLQRKAVLRGKLLVHNGAKVGFFCFVLFFIGGNLF